MRIPIELGQGQCSGLSLCSAQTFRPAWFSLTAYHIFWSTIKTMAFLLKVKAFHFQTKIVIKKLTRLALVWASATVYPLVQSPLLPLQKTLNTWETTFCTAHSQIRNHFRISVIRQCLSYKHIPRPYLTTNGNGFRVFFLHWVCLTKSNLGTKVREESLEEETKESL